jgi:hypothetical protein
VGGVRGDGLAVEDRMKSAPIAATRGGCGGRTPRSGGAAELFPGSRGILLAPAIVGPEDARELLLADRTIEAALDADRRDIQL